MYKYGVNWSLSSTSQEAPSEVSIELECYAHPEKYRELGGTLDSPYDHFKRALHLLYITPFTEGNRPLVWNDWTDERCWAWCNESFHIEIGCAAAGKSNDVGAFAVVDWWADPVNTRTVVCSTTRDMLATRIWESVERYWAHYKNQAPGKLVASRLRIVNDGDGESDDEVQKTKAGIHGVAVQMGTVEQARGNIIGTHLPRIRLVIDEMQATRPAAIEARANLSKGCDDFKFVGLANPESHYDPAGKYCTPVDGWESVDVETHKWKTKQGTVYHYDGYNSPAVIEPDGAKKYPFLIKQSEIDRDLEEVGGNEKDPTFMTFVRGFPPAEGFMRTVMNQATIQKYGMRREAEWAYESSYVGGIDPAFTSGGDKAILQIARIGYYPDGTVGIAFLPPKRLKIEAVGNPMPPIYQLAAQVKDHCLSLNMSASDLCVDETGVQSLGSVLDMEWEKGCMKVSFSQSATELPLYIGSRKSAKEEYGNLVTELWYCMEYYGRFGHIRQLPVDVAHQLTERQVRDGEPKRLESKVDMKSRLGHSPDEADAAAMCMAVIRMKMGLLAGAKKIPGDNSKQKWSRDFFMRTTKQKPAEEREYSDYGLDVMGYVEDAF